MPQAKTEIKTEQSQKYINMLGKHFSRKVTVKTQNKITQVNFPVGLCYMRANEGTMFFLCESEKEENLDKVKSIITGHITLIKELRKMPITWA